MQWHDRWRPHASQWPKPAHHLLWVPNLGLPPLRNLARPFLAFTCTISKDSAVFLATLPTFGSLALRDIGMPLMFNQGQYRSLVMSMHTLGYTGEVYVAPLTFCPKIGLIA